MAVDLEHERLFVCALGNDTLEVVDLKSGERIRSVGGLNGPQGVAYIPPNNRIFVADDGGSGALIDGGDFEDIGHVDLYDDADNVRYDETSHQIFVGYGSGFIGTVDTDGKKLGAVELAGHPEAFQLEKKGPRIFVNVPAAQHVAVIDRNQGLLLTTWKLDSVAANFPMALDEEHHRLFIGCRNPAQLVVLDTDTGKTVTTERLAGDADDIFYDSAHQRIYVICGEGRIDVLKQTDADHYEKTESTTTAPGARTGLLVPELGSLFIAVPARGDQTAEIRRYKLF